MSPSSLVPEAILITIFALWISISNPWKVKAISFLKGILTMRQHNTVKEKPLFLILLESRNECFKSICSGNFGLWEAFSFQGKKMWGCQNEDHLNLLWNRWEGRNRHTRPWGTVGVLFLNLYLGPKFYKVPKPQKKDLRGQSHMRCANGNNFHGFAPEFVFPSHVWNKIIRNITSLAGELGR